MRRCAVRFAVVAALAAVSQPAAGQLKGGAPSAVGPAACTALTMPADARRVSDTVFATLRRVDRDDSLPTLFVATVLLDVRSRWAIPVPLELPVLGLSLEPNPSRKQKPPVETTRTFAVEVGFSIHDDGRVTGISVSGTSLSAAIDASVVAALHAADTAQSFPPMTGMSLRGDSAVFTMRLYTGRDSMNTSLPMKVLDVPVEGPFESVTLADSGHSPVRYPVDERRRGVDGFVQVSFVVDEDGRVILGTQQIWYFSGRPFLREVVRGIPEMRFKPARLRGCPVKVLVRSPWVFTIQR